MYLRQSPQTADKVAYHQCPSDTFCRCNGLCRSRDWGRSGLAMACCSLSPLQQSVIHRLVAEALWEGCQVGYTKAQVFVVKEEKS